MTEQTSRSNELLALAERVEALTGPDRKLDGEIWFWSGDHHVGAAEAGVSCREAIDYFWGRGGAPSLCYTASLDAAMSLVPANSLWSCGSDIDGPYARVVPPVGNGWIGSTEYHVLAATPALALTAAALRALAQELNR